MYFDNRDDDNIGKILNFGVRVKKDWQTMADQMDNGLLPYNIRIENAGQSYNFENQNSVVCNSKRALRLENKRSDNNKRSEIAITLYGNMLDEQFYEWDMMLGDNYSVIDETAEIIMQMHDIPDNGSEAYIAPSFSIYLKSGKYYIHSQYSEFKSSNSASITQINTELDDSYLNDIGKWVHWTLHIKWAYNEFFEPFLYLYKDGKLVYESQIPNVVNAAACPYLKLGVYTFNWIEDPTHSVSTDRTMYLDNIKPSY